MADDVMTHDTLWQYDYHTYRTQSSQEVRLVAFGADCEHAEALVPFCDLTYLTARASLLK